MKIKQISYTRIAFNTDLKGYFGSMLHCRFDIEKEYLNCSYTFLANNNARSYRIVKL